MKKTTYKVAGMDCASEEQLVRMKLEPLDAVRRMEFDLDRRTVAVYHDGDVAPVTESLDTLRLNSSLLETADAELPEAEEHEGAERKMLIIVLCINAALFLTEIVAGFLAHSMGLVADSLDMLADALVYGLSLYAVGRAVSVKKRIAKTSGYFQLALAVFGLVEVVRRFLGFGETPVFQTMILVSVLALIGNLLSLVLLRRSKNQEAHIKASQIFTSNDVLANAGVVAAGTLVYLTDSRYPDLVVGTLIFLIVARGSYKIMQLSK